MKTIIHIDQHRIRKNRKTGSRDPVITVKDYRSNLRAHTATINGPCKIIYSPDKPLKCGATVWIESTAEVTIQPENVPSKPDHQPRGSELQAV